MKTELSNVIASIRAINTHTHHEPDVFFEGFGLNTLLRNSYVAWCGAEFDDSQESRQKYLDLVCTKSYFVWLQKSLKSLYGFSEDLSADNWDTYSDTINNAHTRQGWRKSILTDVCRYDRMILDAYWYPGSDNDDTALFAPTFRIDPLFLGYSRGVEDQDGNSVYGLYGQTFDDLDVFMDFSRQLITQRVRGGCVALKNAAAYMRSLDFAPASRDQAACAFRDPSAGNIKAFQDWFFSEVCTLAAELNVPVQCHTGLGCLDGTRAINLRSIISRHPHTRFVIFHGGFPWTDDVLALLHFFPNVYADICWLPLLSPDTAEHTLHRMIEVATADKISWGCDTWTAEESYGARLAVNSVLKNVLEAKVRSEYFSVVEAERLAHNILRQNAMELYGLSQDG